MPDCYKLRKMLDEVEMTQRELALRMGVSECRVSYLCNNDVNATEQTLKAIKEATGCCIDDII